MLYQLSYARIYINEKMVSKKTWFRNETKILLHEIRYLVDCWQILDETASNRPCEAPMCYKSVSGRTVRKSQGSTRERLEKTGAHSNDNGQRANPHTLERRAQRAFKKMPMEAQDRVRKNRRKEKRRQILFGFAHLSGAMI